MPKNKEQDYYSAVNVLSYNMAKQIEKYYEDAVQKSLQKNPLIATSSSNANIGGSHYNTSGYQTYSPVTYGFGGGASSAPLPTTHQEASITELTDGTWLLTLEDDESLIECTPESLQYTVDRYNNLVHRIATIREMLIEYGHYDSDGQCWACGEVYPCPTIRTVEVV